MKKIHSARLIKTLALAAALTALALTLAACGNGASVTGSWSLESVEGSGNTYGFTETLKELQEWGGSAELVFGEDGKGALVFSMWGMEDESPFDYSVQGDVLTIAGSPVRFSVRGGTLTLREDGVTVICTKR